LLAVGGVDWPTQME